MSVASRCKLMRSRRHRCRRCCTIEIPLHLTDQRLRERLIASGRVSAEKLSHPEALAIELGDILTEALDASPLRVAQASCKAALNGR